MRPSVTLHKCGRRPRSRDYTSAAPGAISIAVHVRANRLLVAFDGHAVANHPACLLAVEAASLSRRPSSNTEA